jgi:hypothetical protein
MGWKISAAIVNHPSKSGFAIQVTLNNGGDSYYGLLTMLGADKLEDIPKEHPEAGKALQFAKYPEARQALEDVTQMLSPHGGLGGLWPKCTKCTAYLSVSSATGIEECTKCSST